MNQRVKASNLIKAFLTAEAMTVTFALPASSTQFNDTVDFVSGRIYELLGEYSFVTILLFAVFALLYAYLEKKENSLLFLLDEVL